LLVEEAIAFKFDTVTGLNLTKQGNDFDRGAGGNSEGDDVSLLV
jgi:hypothetical protein